MFKRIKPTSLTRQTPAPPSEPNPLQAGGAIPPLIHEYAVLYREVCRFRPFSVRQKFDGISLDDKMLRFEQVRNEVWRRYGDTSAPLEQIALLLDFAGLFAQLSQPVEVATEIVQGWIEIVKEGVVDDDDSTVGHDQGLQTVPG